jgi:hypothetical protein
MSDRFEFCKRTIEDGWAEYRVAMERARGDAITAPDYELSGEQARLRFAKFVLATAAGIAHSMGEGAIDSALLELWARIEEGEVGTRGRPQE